LSGKYGPDIRPETGRLMSNKEYTARYGEPWVFETASRFTQWAHANGYHPVSLAIAWVASHADITCPIIGARNLEQLKSSLDSVTIDLTPGARAEISDLSRTPPLATDRLEEQQKAGR